MHLDSEKQFDEDMQKALKLSADEANSSKLPLALEHHPIQTPSSNKLYNEVNGVVQIIDDAMDVSKEEDSELARAIQNSMDERSKTSDGIVGGGRIEENVLRTKWTPSGEDESFPAGVGLKNIGNTCYVNALIQTYFMIPSVLESIVAFPLREETIPKDHIEDVHMTEVAEKKVANHLDEKFSGEFLFEMRKLFTNMVLSNKTYVDPSSALQKLKNAENKQYQIGEMEDLPEFNSLFLSRLEQGIEFSSVHEAAEHFKKLFYGTSVIHFESQEEDMTHIRKSSTDTFNHLILPITPETKSFVDSIELCMKDDSVEYTTDKKFKTTARKTVWFKDQHSIPPVLFLQTSRAVYDTQNQITKLHTPIQFPEILNLAPYMEENSSITEQIRHGFKTLKAERSQAEKEIYSYLENFNNRNVGLLQALETSTDRLIELRREYGEMANAEDMSELSTAIRVIQKEQERISKRVVDLKNHHASLSQNLETAFENKYPNKVNYTLYSIIMHSGRTALAGHYWSYVRYLGGGDNNTWIKFNDTQVVRLDTATVMKEAFSSESNSSAYCVVYIDEEKVGRFTEEYKKALLEKVPNAIKYEIEHENYENARKYNPEALRNANSNLSPKDRLKMESLRMLKAAKTDAENSHPGRDYRIKDFIAFLRSYFPLVSDVDQQRELEILFHALILKNSFEIVFGTTMDKDDEHLAVATELMEDEQLILTAIELSANEADNKALKKVKLEYEIFRKCKIAFNRALSSITKTVFTEAINYLAYVCEECHRLKCEGLRKEILNHAQILLDHCIVGFYGEMVTFMEFEPNDPAKQIANFCVKAAVDYGSTQVCKYLYDNIALLKQQYSNCMLGYGTYIDDLKRKYDSPTFRNYKPLFTVDSTLIHIAEKYDEHYYVAEFEEASENYPLANGMLQPYAEILNEHKP